MKINIEPFNPDNYIDIDYIVNLRKSKKRNRRIKKILNNEREKI